MGGAAEVAMSKSDRKPISRLAATAAFGIAIALGASACGGSPASKQSTSAITAARSGISASAADKGTVSVPARDSTTTVKPPPLTPTFLDIQACRSFVSFKDFASGGGDTAVMAKGEVGGMIFEAQQASAKAGGKGAPAKLLADLQNLLAATNTKQWDGHASEAKLPQMAAVAADCKPVLS